MKTFTYVLSVNSKNRILHASMVIALLFFGILFASAEEGDDTLRYFLSKSDLVVSGIINSNLVVITADPGMPIYLFEIKVDDVLKGEAGLKGKNIPVSITRLEGGFNWKGDPLLKVGARCILFLRSVKPPNIPTWREADVWFAVQPPNPMLEKSLKRLVSGK